MIKLTLLPFVIVTMSAMLAWAMARYAEISSEQRETAATHPRSRPYATRLPDSLIQR